jgi:ABC-type nitrate/sulfonate/bicarbonate transport system substrate-binding protein
MKARSALTLLGVALLLAGCGGGGSEAEAGADQPAGKRTIGVVFDGRVNATSVGVRLGEERGYFEDRGRDVWSGSPIGPNRPILYVLSEAEDVGITSLPEFLLAKEERKPIVAIGSLLPQATISMIWLKRSGIDDIADLKGKTIAIPGLASQMRLLEAVLKRAGLTLEDVEVKRGGFKLLPALLGGRVDAIFGGSWNIQGAILESRGVEPVIRRASALGLPDYDELVLFTRKNLADKEPDLVRDFMAGVDRSTAAAAEDPEAAAKLLKDDEADPEATPQTSQAELDATLPLLSKTGYIDPARVESLERWMRREGMLRRQLPVSELFTEESLQSP